jgi:hypothetical protein
VAPGSYRLVLERTDRLQWRQEISLDAGPARWERSLTIPPSTAQVTGRLAGVDARTLTFWRQDRTLIGTVSPDPDGSFTITDLPPGKYGIGPVQALTYHMPPLLDLDLQPGQHRIVDLDLKALPLSQKGFLNVQVLDETAAARRDARLWLEGPAGRVEPLQFTAASHAFLADPGRQSLHVEVPGYRPVERDVVIEADSLWSNTAPAQILVALQRR